MQIRRMSLCCLSPSPLPPFFFFCGRLQEIARANFRSASQPSVALILLVGNGMEFATKRSIVLALGVRSVPVLRVLLHIDFVVRWFRHFFSFNEKSLTACSNTPH